MRVYKFLTYVAVGIIGLAVIGATVAFVFYTSFKADMQSEIETFEAAMRERGEPVTLAELDAYYPAVPDEENAALVYLQICDLHEELDPGEGRYTHLRDAEESPDFREELAEYAASLAPLESLLEEALKRPSARYPVDLTLGMNVDMSHLKRLRALARALSLLNIHVARQGDTDRVIAYQRQFIHLAESLRMEPLMISQLVRVAFVNFAKESLSEALSETALPPDALHELQNLYGETDGIDAARRALIGERCSTACLFESLATGDMDAVSDTSYGLETLSDSPWSEFAFRYQKMLIYRYTDRIINPEGKSLQDMWRDAETAVADTEQADWRQTGVQLLSPVYDRYVMAIIRMDALLTMMDSAAAIDRSYQAKGHLPDSLSELVPEYLPATPIDPFDGQRLRYIRNDTGYTLYSVHMDRKDDGGVEGESAKEGDLVFTVAR